MVSGMQECLGQDQVSVAESWENPGDRDRAITFPEMCKRKEPS